MYSIAWVLLQNKDALLALPEWAKTLCLVGIVWMFVSAVLKQIKGLLWVAIIAAIVYFGCTYFGVI